MAGVDVAIPAPLREGEVVTRFRVSSDAKADLWWVSRWNRGLLGVRFVSGGCCLRMPLCFDF